MAYTKAKLKAVTIKRLLVLDHFDRKNKTNVSYTGFIIHLNKTHFKPHSSGPNMHEKACVIFFHLYITEHYQKYSKQF